MGLYQTKKGNKWVSGFMSAQEAKSVAKGTGTRRGLLTAAEAKQVMAKRTNPHEIPFKK